MFERLTSIGCGFERVTPRIVALDIPAEVDADVVYAILEEGIELGIWWFDEMHCGHPLKADHSPA